jgi:hypothetical protein
MRFVGPSWKLDEIWQLDSSEKRRLTRHFIRLISGVDLLSVEKGKPFRQPRVACRGLVPGRNPVGN